MIGKCEEMIIMGGVVAQRLERLFPLPGFLGSNPIGDKHFWGFRYEINQHLEGFLPAKMVLDAAHKNTKTKNLF